MEILIGAQFDRTGPALEIPGIGILESQPSTLYSPYSSVILNRSQLLKLQYQIAQELLYEKEIAME